MGMPRPPRALRAIALAWFALVVLVGSLAPFARAGSHEIVCSSGGAVEVAASGAPMGQPGHGHALDCALCLPLFAPPSAELATPLAPAASGESGPSFAVASAASAPGWALPPSRAPPSA